MNIIQLLLGGGSTQLREKVARRFAEGVDKEMNEV